MIDITWTHPALSLILRTIPIGVQSLLDIGCNKGIVGAVCRIYREPNRLVGVDAHGPYLQFCKKYQLYDECIRWNLQNGRNLPFNDKEFEVITCIEVIEHLSRKEGEHLLDDLERLANHVVISTPNIFYRQPGFDCNIYQDHRSRWTVKDFRMRSYRVYGIGGLKIFGRHLKFLSAAFGAMTRETPFVSTMLLCIKNENKHGMKI